MRIIFLMLFVLAGCPNQERKYVVVSTGCIDGKLTLEQKLDLQKQAGKLCKNQGYTRMNELSPWTQLCVDGGTDYFLEYRCRP